MGEEIGQNGFDEADHAAYRKRVREETQALRRWFDDKRFDRASPPTTGLELEAWLVDRNALPTPHSQEFIATVNDERVVPELSKFNFEMNVDPRPLSGNFLSATADDLNTIWRRCCRAAETLDAKTVLTGILPMVRDEMLQPDWMTDSNRYKALNEEIMRARDAEPLHIQISGQDTLDYKCGHIMLEASSTSLQAHLKVDQDEAARLYNASVIASGPLVAVSANSPFLYGRSLWAETRIAAFEQSTKILGFRDLQGRNVLRVTLGTGYLRRSLLELFLENLSYPTLLPVIRDDDGKLPHVRMLNGTIWRWNRPIVGFDEAGNPHLRIEHRAMAAAPTIADNVANLAFYFGLALAFGRAEEPPEQTIPFEDARANFYAAARHGLDAHFRWKGNAVSVPRLLLEELLPMARTALAQADVDEADLRCYFDEILVPRVASGINGASWQRRYCEQHKHNFQALTERYIELQSTGEPVHSWPI